MSEFQRMLKASNPVKAEWRDISSAPKDGTMFIGAIKWDDTGEWEVRPMQWWDYAGCFSDAGYAPYAKDSEQPSLWQPLPEPPGE